VTYGMQVCLTALGGKSPFEPAPQARSQSRSRNHSGDDSETTYSDPSTPTSGSHVLPTASSSPPDGDEIVPPAEILERKRGRAHPPPPLPLPPLRREIPQPAPEEHHLACLCGLCEEQSTELSTQSASSLMNCHL
jgi:hypothetical protein